MSFSDFSVFVVFGVWRISVLCWRLTHLNSPFVSVEMLKHSSQIISQPYFCLQPIGFLDLRRRKRHLNYHLHCTASTELPSFPATHNYHTVNSEGPGPLNPRYGYCGQEGMEVVLLVTCKVMPFLAMLDISKCLTASPTFIVPKPNVKTFYAR